MVKERVQYIDFAAGIMISWMISFHALYPMLENRVLSVIPFLYFFMPWFFFKSGMFFRPTDKIKSLPLLKPFIIWSAIGYGLYLIDCFFISHNADVGSLIKSPLYQLIFRASVPINLALWFLPVLLLVKVLSTIMLRYFRIEMLILICALLYLLLCFSHMRMSYFPTWVSPTLWGTVAFLCGKYFSAKSWGGHKVLLFAGLLFYVISLFTQIPSVYGGTTNAIIKVLWLPACVFSCICFTAGCKFLSHSTNELKSLGLSWIFNACSFIGRNSLTFYVSHYIIYKCYYDVVASYYPTYYKSIYAFIICWVFYLIIIVPLCYFLKKH